jgi:integrase/recombinase XerD
VNLLERQELDLLYQHYSVQLQVDLGKKVMLGLLLYQGLTVAELGALQARHIWIKEKRVQIPGARKAAERMLELDPCQLPILEAYLKQRRHHSGALFTGSRRTPASPHHITYRVKHLTLQLRQLNPRILSTAQIRASVITHWLRQHNLREVQYMAGHKYVSSTQRYQTSDLEDLSRQIQRHHPMN